MKEGANLNVGKKIFPRIIILIISFIFIIIFNYIIFIKQQDPLTYKLVIRENIDTINIIEKLQKDYNNKDIIALLNVSNEIEEPIAQSIDNKYYLNHNLNKEDDKYGTTYMDYRIDLNKSKKILIFGHSSKYKDTTFNKLEKYYNKDYYENNKYIKLTTNDDIRTYKIFSVYIETSDWTYMNLNFNNDEDWYNHLKKLKSKSLYDTETNITKDDEILILQTCSNKEDYQKYKKKYLLIIAKKEKQL